MGNVRSLLPPNALARPVTDNSPRAFPLLRDMLNPVFSPRARAPQTLASPSQRNGQVRAIDPRCVSLLTPRSFEAEQYRVLRYVVEQAHSQEKKLCIVGVSSAAAGDGKTLTAVNLAGALAQARESHVLLIDADLRQPAVTSRLGLGSARVRGLVDAILHPDLGLQDVVQFCEPFNLALLPAGRPTTASYEVLKAHRFGALLAEARKYYDYIVIDTPPLLPFPDCRLLGRWLDGFLVVVAANHTPRKLVAQALAIVNPDQLLGLVYNGDDTPIFGYASYYHYQAVPGSRTHSEGE